MTQVADEIEAEVRPPSNGKALGNGRASAVRRAAERLHDQMSGESVAADSEPAWLRDLRRAGIDRFNAVGFPDRREEAYRHTDFRPVTEGVFYPADAADPAAASALAAEYTFGDAAVAELVFVNGRYAPDLSRVGELPRKVAVSTLAEAAASDEHGGLVREHLGQIADREKNAFVALNTGFLNDGAFLHFGRSATVEKPVHLLFVTVPADEPTATHPRVLIVAEENAEATVVESYVGPAEGTYWTNGVTEVSAAADCRIERYKLNQESAGAHHTYAMEVNLARAGKFVSQSATVGATLTRNDLTVHLNGEAATATLNGLVLLGPGQHCDNHTLLDHAAPHCPSYELYKHVLDGDATGVFKGQIFVHREAQKTDAVQNSKTLLLSDKAQMNSQPALEIYADDVKCTHGSTIGPVDEGAIFYLQSRGVSREQALRLMTYAFAADLTRRIQVTPVRERLERLMAARGGLPEDLRIQEIGEAESDVVY